jgi:hypothetical protein
MFSAATKTGSQPSAAYNYIEDVFSTYLYDGNSANNTITNGIDLSTKGGLVWMKSRDVGDGTQGNCLFDTVRGLKQLLVTNTTQAQQNENGGGGGGIKTWNTNGFTITDAGFNQYYNYIGNTYCSWTFRKQPKFFDVVTYTGTGSNTTISHNLGSTPGMIIVKRTDATGSWPTYHSGLTSANYYILLNTGSVQVSDTTYWNGTAPTSTVFSVGTNANVNASGGTYVAYIFASNAGGFGLTGTDNVITCGSFVGNGSGGCNVNLGYEPQYVMTWCRSSAEGANISDVMRGWGNTQLSLLRPWNSGAESTLNSNPSYFLPTATGFKTGTDGLFTSGDTFIYMAIRRPMKVPTDATKVFSPNVATLTGSANTVTTNFPVDLAIPFYRDGFYANWFDRLRGDSQSRGVRLRSASTAAEVITSAGLGFDNNTGYVDNYDLTYVSGTGNYVYWNFSRRPGFFDVVCYTGTGSATTQAHNLGVVPELMIVKKRVGSATSWLCYVASLGNTVRMVLNNDGPVSGSSATFWNNTTPTSTVFSVGTNDAVNTSGDSYVAYLFTTCSGVSKVGSYTGNGTTQAIACGFTGGARFVLIKRTDDTSDWFVYDTARGMTTLTDPYLPMNGVTEVATLGSVTTTTGGFTVNAAILAAINTSGASYIFLAIA